MRNIGHKQKHQYDKSIEKVACQTNLTFDFLNLFIYSALNIVLESTPGEMIVSPVNTVCTLDINKADTCLL